MPNTSSNLVDVPDLTFAQARSLLRLEKRGVQIGKRSFSTTVAKLCGAPETLSDETISEILKQEKINKIKGKEEAHTFNVTVDSWVVMRRPLRAGEKVKVYDETGESHSRFGNVIGTNEDGTVRIRYDDGDEDETVKRSTIVPEDRYVITICSLNPSKVKFIRQAVAYFMPEKTAFQNLISYAGCCDLERDVLLRLKAIVEATAFPGFTFVKLHIMDDGLLVDFLIEFQKEGETHSRFIFNQAKTSAGAYLGLQRHTSFNQMLGYGGEHEKHGIVVMSISIKALDGKKTGRELDPSDEWFFKLPSKTSRGLKLSTFLHFKGNNVKNKEMKLQYTPATNGTREGAAHFFDKNTHGTDAGFEEPLGAIQFILDEAVRENSRIMTHASRMAADHLFSDNADTLRKEFVARETFIHALGLADTEFRTPDAQNSVLDFVVKASAFDRIEVLRPLKERKKSLFERVGPDDLIRVQFKSLHWSDLGVLQSKFGKNIGGGKKGRYSKDDFDLAIFAHFDFDSETIDFRALWTTELLEHNPSTFDTTFEISKNVYFHTKKMKKKNKSGEDWDWTFDLEKDAIRGLSVRFAKETNPEKDKWMVDLFDKSKYAGGKKRKWEEAAAEEQENEEEY